MTGPGLLMPYVVSVPMTERGLLTGHVVSVL
jgi:hypothetical protein